MVEQFRTQSIQYQKKLTKYAGRYVSGSLNMTCGHRFRQSALIKVLDAGTTGCGTYLDQIVSNGDFDHLFVIETRREKLSARIAGLMSFKNQIEKSVYKRMGEIKGISI